MGSRVPESLPKGIAQFCWVKTLFFGFRFQTFLTLFLLFSRVGGATSRKRMWCHPIRRSHSAKPVGVVGRAAREWISALSF